MKRQQIKRRPLADSVLNSLKPELKDYQEVDSPGLYFRVKSTGSKSWLLRYKREDGRWAWKGLGGYPAVSGKRARALAYELRQQLANGEALEANTPGYTFRQAAEEWYERKASAGRAKGTLRQMRLYLDKEILPVLGEQVLSSITRLQCTQIQEALESRKAFDMAKKVRGWLKQIFSLAIAQGKCENNPASDLKAAAREKPKAQQYPHLYEPELPAFLKALEQSQSSRAVQLMAWIVLRTACRPGMARWAVWTEFDLSAGLWSIPGAKMKMRRDHIIPLSTQTIADLQELKQITGRNQYLFPGQGQKLPVLSENTLNKCLASIGYKGKFTGHGSRHTASTLLREHGWDKDLVESQLAHVEAGMAGVYNKAQYIEKRREMMQWYSDYLDTLRA